MGRKRNYKLPRERVPDRSKLMLAERRLADLVDYLPVIEKLMERALFHQVIVTHSVTDALGPLVTMLSAKQEPSMLDWIYGRIQRYSSHWFHPAIRTQRDGFAVNVRRILWEDTFGPLEQDDQLHSWCDANHCIRPSHQRIGQGD